jgi:hypothetical protein
MSGNRDLVREIDALYGRYFMPVFREWVSRRGNLTSSPPGCGSITFGTVAWCLGAHSGTTPPNVDNLIRLSSSLQVPSDWNIPQLANKELHLTMLFGDWTRPRQSSARYGAQIGGSIKEPRPGEEDQLTINIWRYPELDWDPKIISMSQVKLKATIAHELEHYLDPSLLETSYNRLDKGVTNTTTLTEHFAYKNQSTEIRAVARSIIVLAEGYDHPIKDELDHCIGGVRRAVLLNPETNREECESMLGDYRNRLVDELVYRLPELKGKL